MLGWLAGRAIAPHIPVIDKAGRTDDTWARAELEWDAKNNHYICPEVGTLSSSGEINLGQIESQPVKASPNTVVSNLYA
jgi:hypothetical protein